MHILGMKISIRPFLRDRKDYPAIEDETNEMLRPAPEARPQPTGLDLARLEIADRLRRTI